MNNSFFNILSNFRPTRQSDSKAAQSLSRRAKEIAKKFRRKLVLTLVQMSKTPSRTIRALMLRLIITFAVGAATRQRSVLSPWEKTSTRYLRTRHPGRNERSVALRSPSTTERGKSSERPVSGSARESVFLSIATLAPLLQGREATIVETLRQSVSPPQPHFRRTVQAKSTRRRYTTAEHPSYSTITVNDEKKRHPGQS